MDEGAHQVVNLFGRRLHLSRIPLVCHFRRAHQYLFVPGNNKNRALVHGLGVDRCIRSACKARQHDMRTANAANHGVRGLDAGALAQAVRPGSGGIDDPGGFDALFFPAQVISQQHACHAPMADIHGKYLSVIACHRPGFHGLDQPLRHQSLGEFALGILVTKYRPAPAGVEQSLQLFLVLQA